MSATTVFFDGFGYYNTTQLRVPRKWTGFSTGSGTEWTVSTTNPRFTNGSFARLSTGSFDKMMVKTLSASSTWVIGVAFRTSDIGSNYVTRFLQLLDAGTTQCELKINADGTLTVTRNNTALTGGTSVSALSINTWYYIEWKVTIADSISANTCQVRVNGAQWINVTTGQDTKNTANASANQFGIGQKDASTTPSLGWDFTDIYVDTGTTFLGNMRCEILLPTGAGNSSQFTASAGSNYQCVDENPATDDTDYVESSTAGHIDTYVMGDLSSTPSIIEAIQVCTTDRKTDAGIRTIDHCVRVGSTNYFGADYNQGDTYLINSTLFTTNPSTTGAWSASDVNALEVGQKLVV